MKKIYTLLFFWFVSIIYSLLILFCFYNFSFFKNFIRIMEKCFHSQDIAVFIFILFFILLPLGIFRLIYNKFS